MSQKSVNPNSEISEKCIICSAILSREAYIDSKLVIKPEMIYDRFLRDIWKIVGKLREGVGNKQIEFALLLESCAKLQEDHKLKRDDLVFSLNEIYSIIPTGDNWKYYAQTILDNYDLRRYVNVATSIMEAVSGHDINVDELCDLRKNFYRSNINDSVGTTARDAVLKMSEELEAMADEKSRFMVRIPISPLNALIAGFKAGQLILVGGYRASGKTSLIRTLVARMAIPEKLGSLIFSFECPASDMAAGIVSILSRVPLNDISFGNLSEDEMRDMGKAQKTLANSDVQIVDVNQDVYNICARIEQWMTGRKFGLVFVDYAQLVTETNKKNRSLENEISNVGKMLKSQAMRNPRCCIFLLTQLNTEGASKYARALEDHCDVFIKITDTDKEGIKMIEVAKQRLGEVGEVEVQWWKETGEFY